MGSLHHTNRGAIEVAVCYDCSSPLEGERAVANTGVCRKLDSAMSSAQLLRPANADLREAELEHIGAKDAAVDRKIVICRGC
jgi:hypothetical protein